MTLNTQKYYWFGKSRKTGPHAILTYTNTIFPAILPLLWISACGNYFVVPPGEAKYLLFTKLKQFIAEYGTPDEDWLEFDISRIVFDFCGKNNILKIRLNASFLI